MMSNQINIVKNGVVSKLPPGFRFHPTDEELVVQYLAKKIFSLPLPASIIPEVEVCKSDPWDLPGDNEQTRYFFSSREAKYPNGSRCNRATESGYWKATGIDRKVISSDRTQVCGLKKTLVFYQGKPNKGVRTNWIMHEYRLDSNLCDVLIRRLTMSHSNLASQMEKWVLCRVFLKKRGKKDIEHDEQHHRPKMDLSVMALRSNARPMLCDLNEAPTSSSCELSGLTDESFHESEVESSGNSQTNVSNNNS